MPAEDHDRDDGEQERGLGSLIRHCKQHKLEVGLWATRILTIVFTVGYFLPVFGGHPHTAYYKALMSNAATSALRLHQRMPRVTFSREFAAMLFLEDSAHYLVFNLMFLFAEPVTVALGPIFFFAILHSASYSLTLLDKLSTGSGWWFQRFLISLVELQSRNLLRMVAFCEIFLMPMTVLLVFTGKVSLVTPFMYYRFLGLRYSSRRNPYNRAIFYEMRVSVEHLIASPRVPEFLRTLLRKGVTVVSNMAPAIAAAE